MQCSPDLTVFGHNSTVGATGLVFPRYQQPANSRKHIYCLCNMVLGFNDHFALDIDLAEVDCPAFSEISKRTS